MKFNNKPIQTKDLTKGSYMVIQTHNFEYDIIVRKYYSRTWFGTWKHEFNEYRQISSCESNYRMSLVERVSNKSYLAEQFFQILKHK